MEHSHPDYEPEHRQPPAGPCDHDQRRVLASAVLIIIGLLGLFLLACTILLP